jgi:hypothetical protein
MPSAARAGRVRTLAPDDTLSARPGLGDRVTISSIENVCSFVEGRSCRRRVPHRRRERLAQVGMLLQADGSRHHRLGADGPELTLLGIIDDATGSTSPTS